MIIMHQLSSHGCFPVKSPNYFIAEVPSNPLLDLDPFKSKFECQTRFEFVTTAELGDLHTQKLSVDIIGTITHLRVLQISMKFLLQMASDTRRILVKFKSQHIPVKK